LADITNISGTVVLPTGASTELTLSALSTKIPTLTVTGSRLLTDGSGVTQPISGSVSVSNFPATQAVSGSVSVSNFPATQAISGTVAISNWPATQAISAAALPLPTGASTLAKQPALGTAGVASVDVLSVQGIASMIALKVDGSGVTQPVSGTVSANQAGTWTVTQSGTWTVQPGNTPNTTAWLVKEITNTGRTAISLYAAAAAAGATGVETALTLTKSSGTAATSTATSFVITSGKKFRITAISVATRGNATATAQTTTFNLRLNTAGAVTTTSTPILFSARSATPATASAWDRCIIPVPDGFEILGDGTLQIGITTNCTFVTNAPTLDVNLLGYEY
jgi:hypothetical protein